MKKVLVLAAAAAALFSSRVSAAETLDLKYFTVDTGATVIEDITGKGGTITSTPTIPSPGDLPKPPSGPVINPSVNPGTTPGLDINGTIDTLDKIVNLVDKIFTFIAKNQPVVNLNVNYANAVPFGTSHWAQLQGWSKPATKKYAFVMKNLYGSEVVRVVYQVHWTHSGNFQGVGKFLTGVTVEPLSVVTAWGYNVDLTAEVPDSTVANVGTSANPVASMQVQLKWKVHTIVKDVQQKAIYYVQGDGFMQQIATPFNEGISVSPQKMELSEELTEQLTNVRFN
ncbi:MAG: hypothetical protein A2234_01725 [Elusimicrobia bacterium RIFOXYA2_FULL_58_8]|nr:MAG: hypothetical protein A2285_08440 [Elusimicrobia bacterium RIFOXYA12_FULL_57_11]OGS12305.1 MAG: hypothetical protein A2234_01725 [Elusimicrobia bacterium RIFOXYA2_FULL_58_8]